MRIDLFDYNLPDSFIAQQALEQRDSCKLMLLNKKDGAFRHLCFSEIIKEIPSGGVLVLNNSKVFKARLFARLDSGREIEVFIVEKVAPGSFQVLMRPFKKVGTRDILSFKNGFRAKVVDLGNSIIDFGDDVSWDDFDVMGQVPLPPYIKRTPHSGDIEFYQTVYGEKTGSIAAPTAGLHFTRNILDEISRKNVEIVFITLHISYGTFRPVRSRVVEEHIMLAEYFELSAEVARVINTAKKQRREIIAVGTSAVRALESSVDHLGVVVPFSGFSELFIYPGYKFKVVNSMVTNFHLPRSTPLLLVSALAGRENIINAYSEAKAGNYRFYSYGDAMFIR